MSNDIIIMVLRLLGSLALLVFGMKTMSDTLQKMAGPQLRHILGRMTTNRFPGMLTGILVTAAVQSSTATTVMNVSFVNAGLLTLAQAGADRMVRLRAYYWNGGNMLDLVRYQKKVRTLKKAAGAENEDVDVAEMVRSVRPRAPKWGKYVDKSQVTLSQQMKKWMMIGLYDYVWRLR